MTDKEAYDYLSKNRNTIIRVLELRASRDISPDAEYLTRGMYNNNDSNGLAEMINGAARFICSREAQP